MIDACETAPSWVRAIDPYVPGKPAAELAREMGLVESSIVKLASNENPLGVSEKTKAAMRDALNDIARYPDANGFELKRALTKKFSVTMEQIVLGNGSNDVLDLVGRTFLSPGTSAVYSKHAFAVYPLTVQSLGAQGVETPAQAFGHDLNAMAAAVRDDTRVIFIANPNNPTGTFVTGAHLQGFLQRVPKRVIVVLDEAYTEYLDDADRYNSIPWLNEYPNLIISRTFSKAFALAGMRVGFGLAHPDVINLMNRVRQPFNVNTIAQAGAIAALGDDAFLQRSRQVNAEGMQQIIAGATKLGCEYIASRGNFISVRVGNAGQVFQQLLRRGVIVRPIGAYAMPEWLRVSIGLKGENQRFLDALGEVLTQSPPVHR
jgi:histidinol-phosphate aminotransferase